MTARPHIRSDRRLIEGPVGRIELAVDSPEVAPVGLAFIGHPHPLYGGTLENKVAATLARAFAGIGWLAVRPNFRGVGRSEGSHDHGGGETDDFLHVIDTAPPASHLVLVGSAAGKWPMPAVAAETLVIHGEFDETIPLAHVFEWARPQDLPVVVLPGADHFFHRRLSTLKRLVCEHVLARSTRP